MSKKFKVYLAGPAVFREDTTQYGKQLVELCAKYGLEGLYPFNTAKGSGPSLAHALFDEDLALLEQADAIVADMQPFRGVSMDIGTGWEMGFGYARGLPVIGYTNDQAEFLTRTQRLYSVQQNDMGIWQDDQKRRVEDFNLIDNVMVACSALRGGGLIFNNAEQAIIYLANKLGAI